MKKTRARALAAILAAVVAGAPAGPIAPAVATALGAPIVATGVSGHGGQAEIDECTGGWTRIDASAGYQMPARHDYLAAHTHCGAGWLLALPVGAIINIDGQAWRVVAATDVWDSDPQWPFDELPGELIMQTCYPLPGLRRIVALEKAV